MKVFALQLGQYESTELLGLFATEELAESHIEYSVKIMFGKKAETQAYRRMFSITEMEVEGA